MTTLKFSLNVVDVQGAKSPVERGPLTTAKVALLTEQEANAKVDAVKQVVRKDRFGQLTYDVSNLSPTHLHTKDGLYESSKSFDEGKYLLVVWTDDKSPKAPTVQRLTLSEKQGRAIVKAGWAGTVPPEANLQAANVEFPIAAQGKSAPERSLVTVKVVPSVEFVLLSGSGYWHHHDGTRWIQFSLKHRRTLWADKEMIGGYLVTIFNCEECNRRTYVKALGNNDNWLLVDEVKTNAERKFSDPARVAPIVDDIGILDLFAYLNTVGNKRKGSVWQVNLFTHSWAGGPILWDTDETPAYKVRDDRDPVDLDGRCKDWGPAVLNLYPTLRDAHLFKAVWKLWGCNAQTEVRAGIMAVQQQLKPTFDHNSVFSYDSTDKSERTTRLEYRHHQLTLAHFLKELAENIADGYPGQVPAGAGQTVGCYASAPGFGASMGNDKLFITEKQRVIDGTPGPSTDPDSDPDKAARPLYNFYRRELGSAYKYLVNQQGYFEHRFLLEKVRNWPTPAFATARYTTRDVVVNDTGKQPVFALKVASGATILSFSPAIVKLNHVTAENGLVVAGKKGHLFSGKNGQVSRVLRQGAKTKVVVEIATGRDCVVFMQEDGTLYAMKRTGTAPWAVDTGPIPLQENGATLAPIADGILHKVTPGFIW